MARSRTKAADGSLLSAGLTLQGEWGDDWPRPAIKATLALAREACLGDVRLVSDRQPDGLIVRNKPDGKTPPSIWLHDRSSTTAIIIVDVGASDWSRLSYQFGHELGHVLSNSWQSDANPRPPCQWLEEGLVEAFSLRGLGRVSSVWAEKPPFKEAAEIGKAIGEYGTFMRSKYQATAEEQGASRFQSWFRKNRTALEEQTGLSGAAQAAITTLVSTMEKKPSGVEDLGALNRWPERSALPLDAYLTKWEESCAELGASGRLVKRLKKLLIA